MKVLFHIFFFGCVFLACQGVSIVQSPEKEARICTEICSGCGGPSFTENNVCYCYVEKGIDNKKCVDHAWKKSALYGMEWIPIHPPGRIVRKARPVRGSFLDPVVANVFDKNSPGNLNNEILFKENNFLRKNPIQRLFKRSIKKDLQAQDMDLFNFVDKNSERKKRVPRSLEPSNKKLKNLKDISENFSGELLLDDSKNLIREKRNLAQYGAFPKFGTNQGNMYEMILQYPTVDDEEKIQLLFPNTNGLDVSHEFYYEESDEINDDDFEDDDDNSNYNRMSNNYNPFQSLYTRQVYSADPYLRGARSPYWLSDSQPNAYMYQYPYGLPRCSHM